IFFHHRPENEAKDHRCWLAAAAHQQVAEQREAGEQEDLERAAALGINADQAEHHDGREKHSIGIVSRRTQRPTSGRFRTTSNRLPIHMEAIRPQKRSGRSEMTAVPGAMPWIIIAPIRSAMIGFDGRPKVSSGMKLVCAPALLAASGAATPAGAPLPKVSGLLESFFSSV